MDATGATMRPYQESMAAMCFRNIRLTVVAKFTFICLVLVSLFGIAFKYDAVVGIQTYRPMNIQGVVVVFRSLKTEEFAKSISVLLNVTRNNNNFTNQSVVEQPDYNKSIDLADSQANGYKTVMLKTTESHPKKKLTEDVTKVNQTDRNFLYIDPRVTLIMAEILRIGSKLPGNLTSLQTLASRVKESPEFPGMPDPCVGPDRITGVEDILCMKPPRFLADYKNPCWQDDAEFRCLPYFHLIGVCKSGTSDLFNRLFMHPDIIPNRGIGNKETWYWSWRRLDILEINGTFNQGMTLKDFTNTFVSSGLQATDAKGKHNKITGHGDPMDFWDRFEDRNTPQNIPGADELLWTTPYAVRHVNPNIKLLLMLRDPVERLFSHYIHLHYGTSAQTFHEHVVISIERWNNCTNSHTIRHCIYDQPLFKKLPAPIFTSFYIVHLLEWLKVFPREQILIFRNEDYTVDKKGTLTNIFRFLDVGECSSVIHTGAKH
ncbi:hypothetical protein DPMN_107403 [Dreissena polymorpha]|uniref:Sulfotransferase domain-containing protein n=1 Tax=Dreissena polymorpha TaxID=45954 RepID=A0A9D4K6V9_DREPO|nr:hypothetical protein DPMN_107403 [Dreissena polymorpha]